MPALDERRANPRCGPAEAGWQTNGTLRPGHEIVLVDVTARGVLIETPARVLPGARVELQLGRDGARCRTGGLVRRSRVVSLRPLRFQAAIALEQPLESPQHRSSFHRSS
jgi:hypothetical protein